MTKSKMAVSNRDLIEKKKLSGADLDCKEQIGNGFYRTVYKGLLNRSNHVSNIMVAIKCTKHSDRSHVTETT